MTNDTLPLTTAHQIAAVLDVDANSTKVAVDDFGRICLDNAVARRLLALALKGKE